MVTTDTHNDNIRCLNKTSQELAVGLDTWLEENPGKPLKLDSHSMGTRVMLLALQLLHEVGSLEGRNVTVNLIAPPLTEFRSAKKARLTPPGASRLEEDLESSFISQEEISQIQLPNNVKVRVFLGGKDNIVSPEYVRQEAFQQLLQRLNAEVVQFPNANHMTVLHETTRWLKSGSRVPSPESSQD